MALGKVLEGILKDFSDDYNTNDLCLEKQYEYLVNYLLVTKYHPDAINDKSDLEGLVVDEKASLV